MLRTLILVFWALIILGTVVFAVMYGRPWKYQDREMAWHLSWATLVTGLQPIGLVLARESLIPLAVADGLCVVIVYWRLALLIRARRRASVAEAEEVE